MNNIVSKVKRALRCGPAKKKRIIHVVRSEYTITNARPRIYITSKVIQKEEKSNCNDEVSPYCVETPIVNTAFEKWKLENPRGGVYAGPPRIDKTREAEKRRLSKGKLQIISLP